MTNTTKSFYTAGEFADLFEISKQTLLYYDKTGLLVPEFISTNNYRHYSLKQYLILEIIINMRKLGIPVAKIKDYINNRDEEHFTKLLLEREQECRKIINYNQKIMNNISVTLEQLQKLKDSHLNQITISYRKSKSFYISDIPENCTNDKSIHILAKHNLNVFSKDHFKERAVGWIIKKELFLSGIHGRPRAFFSTLNSNYASNKKAYTRPAGLYMTIRFQGTVRQNIKSLSDKFNDYMQRNNLQAVGDAYVMPLKNYWLTSDTNHYVYQLSMEVKPCENDVEKTRE